MAICLPGATVRAELAETANGHAHDCEQLIAPLLFAACVQTSPELGVQRDVSHASGQFMRARWRRCLGFAAQKHIMSTVSGPVARRRGSGPSFISSNLNNR